MFRKRKNSFLISEHAYRQRQASKKIWGFSLSVLGLGIAVASGAMLERYLGGASLVKDNLSHLSANAQPSMRDEALIRNSVNLMANQVGELRARVESLEKLGNRVAGTAGLLKSPETAAILPVTRQDTDAMPMEEDLITNDTIMSAEEVGRELDLLKQQISMQNDGFRTMELILTTRNADRSRIPSALPVSMSNARISSSYGWRRHPVTKKYHLHSGVDFAAPTGTPIYAASAGIVVEASYNGAYGNAVDIDHGNGVVTRYAHASKLLVKKGDLVSKKQIIARVGSTGRSTGAHLHFEVRVNNEVVDPLMFLEQTSKTPATAVATNTLLETVSQAGAAVLGTKLGASAKAAASLPSGVTTRARMR